MKLLVRKWILRFLVFWSLWRMISYIMIDVVLDLFTFSEPYDIPIGLVTFTLILLLSLILTALLVDGHEKNS